MFDKFGEFNSYKEINELADNLFNEGDQESLMAMAKENGIPEEMVEAYLQGEIAELCDPLTAALGKIEVEEADLKPEQIIIGAGLDYLLGLVMQLLPPGSGVALEDPSGYTDLVCELMK